MYEALVFLSAFRPSDACLCHVQATTKRMRGDSCAESSFNVSSIVRLLTCPTSYRLRKAKAVGRLRLKGTAFRLQRSLPRHLDIHSEPTKLKRMYGCCWVTTHSLQKSVRHPVLREGAAAVCGSRQLVFWDKQALFKRVH